MISRWDEWILWAVTAAYSGICLIRLIKGDPPNALVYFGYTVANVGLIMLMRKPL